MDTQQPSELQTMLSARVTVAQEHRAKALAASAGVSLSEWIRRVIDREWRDEALEHAGRANHDPR